MGAPVTGPRLACRLPGGPGAPGAARRRFRERLAPHLPADQAFELELLLTELVTNAVRHGGMRDGDTVELTMEVGAERVHLEVRDTGPGFAPGAPRPRDVDREGAGGFGLVLLDRFARDWGVDLDRGTRVWADIPRRS